MSLQMHHLDRIDQRGSILDGQYVYDADGFGGHVFVADSGVLQCHPDFLEDGASQGDCGTLGGSRVAHSFNAFKDESPNDTGEGSLTMCGSCSLLHRPDAGWILLVVRRACETRRRLQPFCAGTVGHGTHVASTAAGLVAGTAKRAMIYSHKVVGDDGSGSYAALLEGIAAMLGAANGSPPKAPGVVVMSLGALGNNSDASRHLKMLVGAGLLPVVAAGNETADACEAWPSQSSWGITVGASRSDSSAAMDELASFSNRGLCVDVFAPGQSVTAACNQVGGGRDGFLCVRV